NLGPGSASSQLKYARMQFETRYTYDFVRRFLPRGCRRILEVGCGTGELAARLSKDGYVVIAIDSDRDSVAAARRLGVNAHVATWPDFDQGQFDAVLFTRSLHHIHPLGESVRHAADCLANGGRIIVEDFAYESADEKTLRWFKSAIRYFSIQFFASLEKWIGARNPVKIGSSCAAVTGYDFPLGQSPKKFRG